MCDPKRTEDEGWGTECNRDEPTTANDKSLAQCNVAATQDNKTVCHVWLSIIHKHFSALQTDTTE